MKWSSFAGVAALVAGIAAGPALAQGAGTNFYIRSDTGLSYPRDADFREDNPAQANAAGECFLFIVFPGTCGDVLDNISPSAVFGFGIGYRFTDAIRGDVTLTYRGGYELHEADPAGTFYRADLSSLAVMFNAFYDFPLMFDLARPFVGAGIGVSRNKLEPLYFDCGAGCQGRIPGGTNTGFAWQLMAGVGIPVASFLIVDVGYRYFDAGEFKKDRGFSADWPGVTTSATGDLAAHEVMLIVRVPLAGIQ